MVSIEKITNEIKAIHKGFVYYKKEIKELAKILKEDENILKIVAGVRKDTNRGILVRGLLLATNKRIIFVSKVLFNNMLEEFYFNDINAVSSQLGTIYGTVNVFIENNTIAFDNIEKQNALGFELFLRDQIQINKHKTEISNAAIDDDIVSKLERLAKLKEDGFITDDEFIQQKQKMLGSVKPCSQPDEQVANTESTEEVLKTNTSMLSSPSESDEQVANTESAEEVLKTSASMLSSASEPDEQERIQVASDGAESHPLVDYACLTSFVILVNMFFHLSDGFSAGLVLVSSIYCLYILFSPKEGSVQKRCTKWFIVGLLTFLLCIPFNNARESEQLKLAKSHGCSTYAEYLDTQQKSKELGFDSIEKYHLANKLAEQKRQEEAKLQEQKRLAEQKRKEQEAIREAQHHGYNSVSDYQNGLEQGFSSGRSYYAYKNSGLSLDHYKTLISARPFPNYRSYMREPESYSGEGFRIKGKIFQVISDEHRYLMHTQYNGYFWSGNTIVVDYSSESLSPVEEDIVSVVGKANGTYSYNSTFDRSFTVPDITSIQTKLLN